MELGGNFTQDLSYFFAVSVYSSSILLSLYNIGNDYHGILEPGMTFTIGNKKETYKTQTDTFSTEPVITEKNPTFYTWDDNWTMATYDGGWCAQFEHTVLITDTGVEILTA